MKIQREHPETIRAKRAWADYWDMGDGRSLEKLADLYRTRTGPVPTRQVVTLKNWSRWFGWQLRIEREESSRRADEEDRQRKVWATRKAKDREEFHDFSEQLRRKVRAMLAFPIARERIESIDGKPTTIIEPGRWDFGTTVRMIQMAALLAEQSSGDTSSLNRLVGKITIREIIAEVPADVAAEFENDQRLIVDSDNDDTLEDAS